MTFFVQTYPYAQARPQRRVVRRWAENREQTLGVNIREEDDAYVLSSLVPGLTAEDLNIQVLDDVVRIDGEYKAVERDSKPRELLMSTRPCACPLPLKRRVEEDR
jgi:HSP20 family molecular chaperone IbpA